jgi:hypothetical protein
MFLVVFIQSLVQFFFYFMRIKTRGPCFNFEIFTFSIILIKVDQWNNLFSIASGQGHVSISTWNEVSTHIDSGFVYSSHGTILSNWVFCYNSQAKVVFLILVLVMNVFLVMSLIPVEALDSSCHSTHNIFCILCIYHLWFMNSLEHIILFKIDTLITIFLSKVHEIFFICMELLRIQNVFTIVLESKHIFLPNYCFLQLDVLTLVLE